MTPGIFKKQVGNPINMLSEGRKIFYKSFLSDLLKYKVFLNSKHAHIMKLFIGFLKYLWLQLKLGNKNIWFICTDSSLSARQTSSIISHNLKWEERWSHWSVFRIGRIPIHAGNLEMIGSKPPKGQLSVYKIQLFKHSETVAEDDQRSVRKVTQV